MSRRRTHRVFSSAPKLASRACACRARSSSSRCLARPSAFWSSVERRSLSRSRASFWSSSWSCVARSAGQGGEGGAARGRGGRTCLVLDALTSSLRLNLSCATCTKGSARGREGARRRGRRERDAPAPDSTPDPRASTRPRCTADAAASSPSRPSSRRPSRAAASGAGTSSSPPPRARACPRATTRACARRRGRR